MTWGFYSIDLNCCCYSVGMCSGFMTCLAIFRLVPFLSRLRHVAVSLLYYVINAVATCIKCTVGSLCVCANLALVENVSHGPKTFLTFSLSASQVLVPA